MSAIPASLFKKYDIRGRAAGDNPPLTPDVARLIGQAFGTLAQREHEKNVVVLGHDNRLTSPDLAAAAMAGLVAAGCTVAFIGCVPTPVVYRVAVQEGDVGGMMITGSHLAPDQNGFKLSFGAVNVWGDALQTLRALIEADDLLNVEGGRVGQIDQSQVYMNAITALAPRVRMSGRLHVVVDAGNGTAGLIAPRLFEAWGHRVTPLYCEPDGSFPNHPADPQVAANLAALSATVREVGAHVGIAFDGDADRMGAVDENGAIVAADRLLALLARDLLSRHPGASVVADVLTSQVVFDAIARAGGKPVLWASGHALVKAKMREIGALLGGEMSGHIFMGEDDHGFDDAFLAAGRLLALITRAGSLAKLDASLPRLYSTPEYRPHCPDEVKARVLAGMAAALADDGEIVTVDGVRVQFANGWGIVRASNTEPVLSLRFEAATEADALAYRDRFAALLAAYPEVEALAQ